MGDPICIIHLIVLRANYADMITILRHTVVFGTGEIISVFPVDRRNGYEVADLEKERLRLLKQYIDNGLDVRKVHIAYREEM